MHTSYNSSVLLPRQPEVIVTITHPFSPMKGREYLLIEKKVCWGQARVLVFDENGDYRRFPASWTDLADPDPFLETSAGRAFVRDDGLIKISELLNYIKENMSM